MSCAKNSSGFGNNPLYAEYIELVNNKKLQASIKCKRNRSILPSFTPVLTGLSVNTSFKYVYSLVYVYGSNFLPNGTTFIQFGDKFLPVTFYSSFNLSFVVPLNSDIGIHNVRVVNLYNNNFSPQVNQSNPGNLNFSGSIPYLITRNPNSRRFV